MSRDQTHDHSEYWRLVLTGEFKALNSLSRLFRSVPAAPRCKLCQVPFKGPFVPVFRLFGFRRWALNRQMCRYCISGLDKQVGGAEVPVSLLFADVRNSTSLAEQMSPSEYTDSLQSFFSNAYKAVDAEGGLIDNIVGDGVMAMWIPGFVGKSHPEHAVAAGRRLARAVVQDPRLGRAFPIGIGVHSGSAFVGVVGEAGSRDFTVLGDAANTVSRLASAAQGGELVMSEGIAEAANVDTTDLEHRILDLKGKTESFPAWVERAPVLEESA